jgi:hypothetical protein
MKMIGEGGFDEKERAYCKERGRVLREQMGLSFLQGQGDARCD